MHRRSLCTGLPAQPGGRECAAAAAHAPHGYPSRVPRLVCSSFNSTPPLGYRIANVALGPDGRSAAAHTVFAEGWLGADGEFWGRPTGLLRLPDGSMLVGDDYAHTIYRISYDGPPSPAAAPASAAGRRSAAAGSAAAAVAAAATLAVLVL